MKRLRNLWVGASNLFNQLPSPVKAMSWNALSATSSALAAYFSGEFDSNELKTIVIGIVLVHLASFFTYLAAYFGSKKEVV